MISQGTSIPDHWTGLHRVESQVQLAIPMRQVLIPRPSMCLQERSRRVAEQKPQGASEIHQFASVDGVLSPPVP